MDRTAIMAVFVPAALAIIFIAQQPTDPAEVPNEHRASDRSKNLVAHPTPPLQPVVGPATIIDGDTIRIGSDRIRLHGIDAPESKQVCYQNRIAYKCGEAATLALERLTAESSVRCNGISRDRYDRLIATCDVDGKDIGGWMVEQGYAIAYRKYSSEYEEQEARASESGRGLWSGQFQPPEDWRRR